MFQAMTVKMILHHKNYTKRLKLASRKNSKRLQNAKVHFVIAQIILMILLEV